MDVFKKFRELIGITHYKDGGVCEIPDNFLCKLISCIWCLSIWVGAGLVMAYIFLPTFTIYFALMLSLSTLTILVDKVI